MSHAFRKLKETKGAKATAKKEVEGREVKERQGKEIKPVGGEESHWKVFGLSTKYEESNLFIGNTNYDKKKLIKISSSRKWKISSELNKMCKKKWRTRQNSISLQFLL